MKDTDVTALIAGGGAAGAAGGVSWWKRRKQKKEERARAIASRLFPKADLLKLDREVRNILRHRKIK